MGYIDITYSEKERPMTDYPYKLAEYLYNRFGLQGMKKLLDVCCGRGEMSKVFRSMYYDVHSTDKEYSKFHRFFKLNVRYFDAEKDVYPYPNESFDIVFAKSVLEHFQNPEHFMKECWRILKPDGMLITLTPDWKTQMGFYFDDYTHKQPYTPSAVNDLMKIYNFDVVTCEKFCQVPFYWKHPNFKFVAKLLQLLIPANPKIKNNFLRFSLELMILGVGRKR